MSTDAVVTEPAAVISSPTSRVPLNSPNTPRTVAMPMCLTEKPTFEWAGSTVQVPVGTMVLVTLMFGLLGRSPG